MTSLDVVWPRMITIRPGDSLSVIAKRNGIADWHEIYDLPCNDGFRKQFPDPNQIDYVAHRPGRGAVKLYLPITLSWSPPKVHLLQNPGELSVRDPEAHSTTERTVQLISPSRLSYKSRHTIFEGGEPPVTSVEGTKTYSQTNVLPVPFGWQEIKWDLVLRISASTPVSAKFSHANHEKSGSSTTLTVSAEEERIALDLWKTLNVEIGEVISLSVKGGLYKPGLTTSKSGVGVTLSYSNEVTTSANLSYDVTTTIAVFPPVGSVTHVQMKYEIKANSKNPLYAGFDSATVTVDDYRSQPIPVPVPVASPAPSTSPKHTEDAVPWGWIGGGVLAIVGIGVAVYTFPVWGPVAASYATIVGTSAAGTALMVNLDRISAVAPALP